MKSNEWIKKSLANFTVRSLNEWSQSSSVLFLDNNFEKGKIQSSSIISDAFSSIILIDWNLIRSDWIVRWLVRALKIHLWVFDRRSKLKNIRYKLFFWIEWRRFWSEQQINSFSRSYELKLAIRNEFNIRYYHLFSIIVMKALAMVSLMENWSNNHHHHQRIGSIR